LLFIALLLETGLLLVLIPWSTIWDQNYLARVVPGLGAFIINNYVRGAVSGLGLVNMWSALAELADLVTSRTAATNESE
jgi:hypothetical protein